MSRIRHALPVVLIAIALLVTPARAGVQDDEFGDAPDNATAYPTLAVGGLFPTCTGTPTGFIIHAFRVKPGSSWRILKSRSPMKWNRPLPSTSAIRLLCRSAP